MSALRVTMADIRACGMCGPGTLAFFHRHKLMRSALIREGGVPIEDMEVIDDAMCQQVTRYVRSKNGRK